MAARKKVEAPSTQPEVKAEKRTKKAESSPVADAVTPELLSQLLAQVQQLTQEVSELRSKPAQVAPGIEPVAELEPEDIEIPQEIESSEELEAELEAEAEDAITPEEANALMVGFDEAMAEPSEVDEDAPMSDSDIAKLLSQAQGLSGSQPAQPAATNFIEQESEVATLAEMSDDEIASALEIGAELSSTSAAAPAPSALEVDDDFDFDSLTEEDLAAMVRLTIETQSEMRDKQAEEAALQPVIAPAEEKVSSDVMSADDIASLLNQPDPEGEIVPNESVAMDDDEISRLMAEASALTGTTSKPLSADDLELLGVTEIPKPADPVHPAAVAHAAQARSREHAEFDLGAVKAVPSHLAIRALALPVCFQEGKILCRVAEPIDRMAVDKLSKTIGLGVIIEPAPVAEVVAGLRDVYAEVSEVHARLAMMAGAQKRVSSWEKFSHLWKKGA